LRLARAVRGRLTVSDAGRALWHRRLDSLPERRILVPLSVFADKIRGDTVTLSIEEDR
jgi:hypothetical protein